jgi:hypothetical protein
VRRLAKLIGSGAHEGAQLEQAWSDVTEQTNASASAALGQDELALLAALIRDGVGGAQPVVLVHTLIWQSAPRRAQVGLQLREAGEADTCMRGSHRQVAARRPPMWGGAV